MAINVLPALSDSGLLKAGIPLLMASTPVSAVQPAENARKIKKRVRDWSIPDPGCSVALSSTGMSDPFIILKNPKIRRVTIVVMKT